MSFLFNMVRIEIKFDKFNGIVTDLKDSTITDSKLIPSNYKTIILDNNGLITGYKIYVPIEKSFKDLTNLEKRDIKNNAIENFKEQLKDNKNKYSNALKKIECVKKNKKMYEIYSINFVINDELIIVNKELIEEGGHSFILNDDLKNTTNLNHHIMFDIKDNLCNYVQRDDSSKRSEEKVIELLLKEFKNKKLEEINKQINELELERDKLKDFEGIRRIIKDN